MYFSDTPSRMSSAPSTASLIASCRAHTATHQGTGAHANSRKECIGRTITEPFIRSTAQPSHQTNSRLCTSEPVRQYSKGCTEVQHPQLTVKPHNVSGSLQLGDDPLHYVLIRPLICCQTQQPRQRTSQLSFAQRRAAQDSAGQRRTTQEG